MSRFTKNTPLKAKLAWLRLVCEDWQKNSSQMEADMLGDIDDVMSIALDLLNAHEQFRASLGLSCDECKAFVRCVEHADKRY